MAEALFRHMLKAEKITDIEVFSRGLGALADRPISQGAADTLRAVGVDAKKHQARQISAQDVAGADLILTMEKEHREMIRSDFPEAASKTFLLKEYTGGSGDVRDPIGGSPQDYEKCRIEIQDCLLGLLSKLKERKPSL